MNNRHHSTIPAAAHQEGQNVSEAVFGAVAEAEGVSPMELLPLGTVIHTDALDALVGSMASWPDEPAGTIEFSYSGYRVAVTEDGDVSITELEAQE